MSAAPGTAADAWRAAVAAVLKGAPADTLVTHTLDGLPVQPLYPVAEPSGPAPWRDVGRPFGVVQRVDHPDPEMAGALARADLDGGATGLVFVGPASADAHGFGLPAAGLPAVLAGLPVGRFGIRLDMAGDSAEPLDAILAAAERDGFSPDRLDLDVGLDPSTAGDDLRSAVQRWRERGITGPLVRADGRPHHAAGASEAQELAAVLSAGVAALRVLEPLGLGSARDAISFALAADQHLLLTVAKLRALRRLWAAVETACGLPPRPIRLHAETGWRMLATQDPHTNILRSTIAAAAAILGGADGITALPFTSPLGLPDAFARRLARNTPLVLLAEAHLGRVADPAAGAGAFEAMADSLAMKAWDLFQDMERQGGLTTATQSGWWDAQVAVAREKRLSAIANGNATIVGVTRFRSFTETLPPVLQPMRSEVVNTPGNPHIVPGAAHDL